VRPASFERDDLGSFAFSRMPVQPGQLGPNGILDHGRECSIRARSELLQLAQDVVVDVDGGSYDIFMCIDDIDMYC